MARMRNSIGDDRVDGMMPSDVQRRRPRSSYGGEVRKRTQGEGMNEKARPRGLRPATALDVARDPSACTKHDLIRPGSRPTHPPVATQTRPVCNLYGAHSRRGAAQALHRWDQTPSAAPRPLNPSLVFFETCQVLAIFATQPLLAAWSLPPVRCCRTSVCKQTSWRELATAVAICSASPSCSRCSLSRQHVAHMQAHPHGASTCRMECQYRTPSTPLRWLAVSQPMLPTTGLARLPIPLPVTGRLGPSAWATQATGVCQ